MVLAVCFRRGFPDFPYWTLLHSLPFRLVAFLLSRRRWPGDSFAPLFYVVQWSFSSSLLLLTTVYVYFSKNCIILARDGIICFQFSVRCGSRQAIALCLSKVCINLLVVWTHQLVSQPLLPLLAYSKARVSSTNTHRGVRQEKKIRPARFSVSEKRFGITL